jgi:hypothetical protein
MKTARASLLLLAGALLCATRVWAAGGAIVEIPTAQTSSASSSDQDVTMAGEYKTTRNVIEQEKPVFWDWAFDIGYMSEYNFRGTNLTPDSEGAGYIRADVSKWGFTLGLAEFHQFGTARTNSFSVGEGGGSGAGGVGGFSTHTFPNPFFPIGPPFITASGTTSPQTIQDRFNEIDVFFQYQFALGPVDVTVGDIGFFIDRRAETFVAVKDVSLSGPGFGPIPLPGNFRFGPEPTVGNEQFDRLYIKLSTSKIPHIQPQVTYYQTILNTGQQPSTLNIPLSTVLENRGLLRIPFSYHGGERNDELGGYLEGRLNGNFRITEWLSFNPYGIISASFHDRSEPVLIPMHKKDFIRGRSLSGFNVAQAVLELPIHLLHMRGSSSGPYAPPNLDLYFVPFGWYSYHISDPVPSTGRHEAWGGARFTATF